MAKEIDAANGLEGNPRRAGGVGSGVAAELAPSALAAICAHARREYPRECCGVVYGLAGAPIADRVREARNIQDELHAEDPRQFPRDARTAYHLDVASLLAMSKSLGGSEPARLVYHSHCDVGAYFSESDRAAAVIDGQPAYPVDHLVVAVRAAADGAIAEEAAQFSWDAQVASYVEVRRLRCTPI